MVKPTTVLSEHRTIRFFPVTISIDAALIKEIDAFWAARQTNNPASALTRSEIIRLLLRQALASQN